MDFKPKYLPSKTTLILLTLQYLGKETLYRYSHALGLAEVFQCQSILCKYSYKSNFGLPTKKITKLLPQG
jgi:hypothetical protein